MNDSAVVKAFGSELFEVLGRRGFREIGRFVDDLGWFTRTYFNGLIGVHLVNAMGTEVSITPSRQLDFHYSVGLVAEFFGEPLRADSSNDEKARYLDSNYGRIVALFDGHDRGAGLRRLDEYIKQKNRREFGF